MVIGISKDSVASHKKFEEKFGLSITLLSDPDLEVIKTYEVWAEKKLFGKLGFGIVRSAYLIDGDGIILKALNKVKAKSNPTQMWELLLEMGL